MHKHVKIAGIVKRQDWTRLNSYAAHSVFWARRKQDGVQIMSWRYSVSIQVLYMNGDNSDHSGDRLSQNSEKQQLKTATMRVYTFTAWKCGLGIIT